MAPSTGRRVFRILFSIKVLFFVMEFNSLISGFKFSDFNFIIPHKAPRGHVITKLSCYNQDDQSISDISPSDLVMPNLFELGSCGELIVSQTPVDVADEPFHIIPNSSKCSRLKSVTVSKNITVYVKNATEMLAFPKTVYMGYMSPSSEEPLILGIQGLFATRPDGNSEGIVYRLLGKGFENFDLVSFEKDGRQELLVMCRGSTRKIKYHLTVSAETTDGMKGHTNLWIYANKSMLDIDEMKHKAHIQNMPETEIESKSKSKYSPLKFQPKASLSSDSSFLSRGRRQVPNLELQITLNETATGLLFSVASTPLDPTLQYVLYNSTLDNTFIVSADGNVSLVSGAKLDYDNPDTRFPFLVAALIRKNDGAVVTTIRVRITLLDVNDENPYFIDTYYPFMAKVLPSASQGSVVFTLTVSDKDANADLVISAATSANNGGGRFQLLTSTNRPREADIVTVGTGPFSGQYTYSIIVMDRNGLTVQTKQESVTIIAAAELPPQFQRPTYVAKFMEDNSFNEIVDTNIQAKSFQNMAITYTIVPPQGQTSTPFDINSNGDLIIRQRFDYEADTQSYQVQVRATESPSNQQSLAQLTVMVLNRNEFEPEFSLSTYTATVSENKPVGQSILTLTATDRDANTFLSYRASDDHFSVTTQNMTKPNGEVFQVGILIVKRTLDFDRIPQGLYKFTVFADDLVPPARTGQAEVRIQTTNVNDEAPEFNQTLLQTDLRLDATVGHVVIVIRAIDPDGDSVRYSFSDNTLQSGPFAITGDGGIITLRQVLNPNVSDMYVLQVIARDDGTCCINGSSIIHTATANVTINIVTGNAHSPEFRSCADYSKNTSVDEEVANGTPVVTVSATDEDRGKNGEVRYTLLRRDDGQPVYFAVNETTGKVTVAARIDRETLTSSFLTATIKANDLGEPSSESVCSFIVTIRDVNDNKPMFTQPSYQVSVMTTTPTDTSVIQIVAVDQDIGINAKIVYSFEPASNPLNLFKIDPDIGMIRVNRTLSARVVNLTVKATDQGLKPQSSTVIITITITDDATSPPPSWSSTDVTSVSVTENVFPSDVAVLQAMSNNANATRLGFVFVDANRTSVVVENFRCTPINDTFVRISLERSLDYETKNKYNLVLRASSQTLPPLSTDKILPVTVIDQNDEIPDFLDVNYDTGFHDAEVLEGVAVGTFVTEVTAIDKDGTAPFNTIQRYLIDDSTQTFAINSSTGRVTTLKVLDREQRPSYFFLVMAVDGAPSSRPGVTGPNTGSITVSVTVKDVNDNTPTFAYSIYNISVKEDTPIGGSVASVKATDLDTSDELKYSIKETSPFTIQLRTGQIDVAGVLDYESPIKSYTLTVLVNDGLHSASTTVQISLIDVNDNAPVVLSYSFVDIVEEDNTNLPRKLVKVSVTDPDIARPNNFEFSLSGSSTDGSDPKFWINQTSGELFLLKSLDRDYPNGRAEYTFNVVVQDEPNTPTVQYGYGSISIKPLDINDNAPVFQAQSLKQDVPEQSKINTKVGTVIAEDYDFGSNGTFSLSLESQSDPGTFRMDPNGDIYTNVMPASLDRETKDFYTITVRAIDNGVPKQLSSTAIVNITLDDINDHDPFFNTTYNVTMSEHAQVQSEIVRIRAYDLDIGINAAITYSVPEEFRTHFKMDTDSITNEGVLTVFKQVDFDIGETNFTLIAYAADNGPILNTTGKKFTASTTIYITVTDYNDEKPIFDRGDQLVNVAENVAVGTSLASFTAYDRDTGVNGLFDYFISLNSDAKRQFRILQSNQNIGEVFVNKALDREDIPIHILYILAIDRGNPQNTGTATLTVSLTDINDNFPRFAESYRPYVTENQDYNNAPLQVLNGGTLVIRGVDPDLNNPPPDDNGPPFEFACGNSPLCTTFTVIFDPAGDNGNGSAAVRVTGRFDREQTKFYYLPIISKDRRGKTGQMTGTNTLTIEVRDVNDNPVGPGQKNILVYNYKGLFKNIQIGRVYAADLDDWDIVDKRFELQNAAVAGRYVSVDATSGFITLLEKVPPITFTITVKVTDVISKASVMATVTIEIVELSEEAVRNSGSTRISGITDEYFVTPVSSGQGNSKMESPADKFRNLLAKKLNTDPKNVYILSIMHPADKDYTDIRYAAHGSPWYQPSRSDGIVNMYRSEFQATLGGKGQILMTPIDECLQENCEGGCYNWLNIQERPALVNTNSTSFVGVWTRVEGLCGCHAKNFSMSPDCTADYCYNGGTCVKDDWKVISCQCLPEFEGPRCQQLRHSFDGSGYALYKSFEQCEESRTSIEILTQQSNSLIFYNGPFGIIGDTDPVDYISLQLKNGYPYLEINQGTGTLPLVLNGLDSQKKLQMSPFDDGKWHRIDIIRDKKFVRLVADYCLSANVQGGTEDRLPCEASGFTPGENMFLNVEGSLQLGGVISGVLSSPPPKFKGCMKQLRHNTELYDLTSKDAFPGTADGCSLEDNVCNGGCGNGSCLVSSLQTLSGACVCKPGYRGPKCQTSTTIVDFRKDISGSFMYWRLRDSFLNVANVLKTEVRLSYRTRDTDGLIFHLSDRENSRKYIQLQLQGGKLQVSYDMGDFTNILSLANVSAGDGQWHLVTLQRFGKEFILMMDGGEGRFYTDSYGPTVGQNRFALKQDQVYSGAELSYNIPSAPSYIRNNLESTCMNDVRLGAIDWLPMKTDEVSSSSVADTVNSINTVTGCVRNDCTPSSCSRPFVCVPLWETYECRCDVGMEKVGTTCVVINPCNSSPCLNGGTCRVAGTGFTCSCPIDWSGNLCQCGAGLNTQIDGKPCTVEAVPVDDQVANAGLIGGVIAAVIVLILIIVLVLVFLLRYRKPEKELLEDYPDDDIRENIMYYDEEGAGEEDQTGYDLSRLQKPDDGVHPENWDTMDIPKKMAKPVNRAPGDRPDIEDFITSRMNDADNDPNAPPFDTMRNFSLEGNNSETGSLSSLNTTSTGSQDYDYLNDWGPKFAKLADMYNNFDETEG